MWRFIVGLVIKVFMLGIMIWGLIATYSDNPDSAAAFVLLGLFNLFAVLEHIFNPRNELTGEYKII